MRFSRIITAGALVSIAACAGRIPREDLSQLSGEEMYGRLCTSCHGAGGKGNGLMAPLLKVEVPDLTRIAQRYGGEFPAEQVKSTIDGRFERPAHGLPYMPVWGWELDDTQTPHDAKDSAHAGSTIERLVVYLRSIQEH